MISPPKERFDSRTATWVPLQAPATDNPASEAAPRPATEQRSAPSPQRLGRPHLRTYHAARGGRLAGGALRAGTTTADHEIGLSIHRLRNGSRALIRDAAYAKRAQTVVVNNVVGAGIGLQAQVRKPRGAFEEKINASIEAAWQKWCLADACHVGGVLHFSELERLAMAEIFEAGEVFIRKHYRPFGRSQIPFALEIIEPERIAEDYMAPQNVGGNEVRLGVEVDRFYRPIAYYIRERHPGDIRASAGAHDRVERVPADQVIHLYVCNRWPQTRGVPWLHAVALRLNDMDGYAEAEIVAARGAASYMGFIKTPDNSPIPVDEQEGDGGDRVIALEAGTVEQLPPGWDITMNNPNRPNPNMDPFMRLMLREVAAGSGPSYESLSRDYAQGSYANSRLGLLDDRDTWRVLQTFFVRGLRVGLHAAFMQQAVLSRQIVGVSVADYFADPDQFNAARFKTRGWSWIDPTKEVAAFKEAVRCGFMTVADVIAATSPDRDIEDVIEGRAVELEAMHSKKLVFDTDPEFQPNPQAEPAKAKSEEDDDEGGEGGEGKEPKQRVLPLREAAHG